MPEISRSSEASPLAGATALAVITLVVALAILQLAPAEIVPATAPPDVFSAERAMRHVDLLAAAPRPMGSVGHRQARDHLHTELRALGLDPQIQTALVARQYRFDLKAIARVQNVVVRLVGRQRGPGVLLMAHYDTRPNTPGAGDDAAGVATILETLRALMAGPPLEHDVLALFSDSEEPGLLGARAFVDQHPWIDDVGLVINFEGRGHRGAVQLFETGPDNGRLIAALRQVLPDIFASSLSNAVYQILPNDTDFSPFREAGHRGFNLAFIDGIHAYHTALDTPVRLDRRSLQQHGDYAVALTRHLAASDVTSLAAPDVVFFNLWRGALVIYREAWAVPLAIVSLLLFLAVVALARRRLGLRLGAVGMGLALAVGSIILGPAAVFGLARLLSVFAPQVARSPHGLPYDSDLFVIASLVLLVAIVGSVHGVGRRWTTSVEQLAGALGLWLVAALGSALVLPGVSFLFLWPAVALTLGLSTVAFLLPTASRRLAVLTAFAVPAMLIVAPIFYLLHVALTFHLAAATALLATAVLILLAPALVAAVQRPWLHLATLGGLALALVAVIAARVDFAAERPETGSLFYFLDGASQEAHWYSFEEQPHAWMAQIFDGASKRGPLPDVLASDRDASARAAVVGALGGPVAERLADVTRDAERRLTLRLFSSRQAPILRLTVRPGEGAEPPTVRALRCGDQHLELGDKKERLDLILHGLPEEGCEIELATAAGDAIEMLAADQSYGLPAAFVATLGPLPDDLIPHPHWRNLSTFVSQTFSYPALSFPAQP